MIKHFNKHVRNFLTSVVPSTIKKGEYYYGIQDPTYLGFDLNFIFYPDHMLDDPAPYLRKVGLLYPEEYRDSAISYLYRVGRLKEKEMLKEFRSQLMFVVNEMPWYFQSVTGLDRYFKSFFNVEDAKLKGSYESGEFKIEVNCLETYDRRMSYMFDLLHASCIDSTWERYIIPHNLCGFETYFHIYEIRNVTGVIRAFRDVYNINEKNVTSKEVEEAKLTIFDLLENNFYFHVISINAMFDFDYSMYNSISNDKMDEYLKFKFYLHRIGPHSVKNYYGFFKWFVSSYDLLNKFYEIKNDDTFKLLYQDKYLNTNDVEKILSSKEILKSRENLVKGDIEETEEKDEKKPSESDTSDTLTAKLFKWGKEMVDKRFRDELKKIAPKEVKRVLDVIDQVEFKSKIYLNQYNMAFKLIKGTIEDINKKGINGPLDLLLYGKNIYEGIKGLKNITESVLRELGIIRKNQPSPKKLDRENILEGNLEEGKSTEGGIGEVPVKKLKEASDRINKKEEETEKRNYIGIIDFSSSPSLRKLKEFVYTIELIKPPIVTVIMPIEFEYVLPRMDIIPIELYKSDIVTEISPIDFIKPSIVDNITSISLNKPGIIDTITGFDLVRPDIIDTITGFDLIRPDIIDTITGFDLVRPDIIDTITGFDLIRPDIIDTITGFDLIRPDILKNITRFKLKRPNIKKTIDNFELIKSDILKDIVSIDLMKPEKVNEISPIKFLVPVKLTTITGINFIKSDVVQKIKFIDFKVPFTRKNITGINLIKRSLDSNITDIKFNLYKSDLRVSNIMFDKSVVLKNLFIGNLFKLDKSVVKRISNVKFKESEIKKKIFNNLFLYSKKDKKVTFLKFRKDKKKVEILDIDYKLNIKKREIIKILIEKGEIIKSLFLFTLKKPIVETKIKPISLAKPEVLTLITPIKLIKPSIVEEITSIRLEKKEKKQDIDKISFEKIVKLDKRIESIKFEDVGYKKDINIIDRDIKEKKDKNINKIEYKVQEKKSDIDEIKFLKQKSYITIREKEIFLEKKKQEKFLMIDDIIRYNISRSKVISKILLSRNEIKKMIENVKLKKPSVKTDFVEIKLKPASKLEIVKFGNVYKIDVILMKNLLQLKQSSLENNNVFKNSKRKSEKRKIERTNIFKELKK